MAEHGTRTKYNTGCRCEQCVEANREGTRRFRDRNEGTLTADDPRHGKASTYANYRCRCEPCAAAHLRKMRFEHAARVKVGLAADDPRHGTVSAYTGWGCRCLPCGQAVANDRRARKATR